MILINLRFAFRQLSKNKVFSIINVLGLALSMVACLLIYKYVSFEKSYDTYHDGAENIFRIYRIAEDEDPNDGVASVFAGMKPVMDANLPELVKTSRFIDYGKIYQSFAFTHYASDGSSATFNVPKGYFVDNDALKMLTFTWLEGANSNSLAQPYEIVISESFAKKFFGSDSALGKVLRFKNSGSDFKITGVFKDMPANTHIKFDVLCSFNSLPKEWNLETSFNWGNFYTYIKTVEGVNVESLEKKINDLFATTEGAWFREEGVTMKLQDVESIHLNSHHSYELEANGNADTVVFLSIIGIFIMVIAWVNYINLSTSKLVDRAKEVGIRKVMGGYKRQLIAQFLMESVLMNVLALIVSLTLLQLTRSFFEELIGIPVTFFNQETWQTTMVFAGLFTLGSIVFGLYPALLFSAQKTSIVLRGKSKVNKSGLVLRRALTVFQYTIAVVLILGTIAVKQQLSYMQNESSGMDIDRTLIVKKPFVDIESRETSKSAFINRVNQLSEVKMVSASSEIPGYEISRMRWIALGPGSEDKALYAKDISIDESFIDLYDIQILYGRSFSKGFSDSASVVLSLSAAQELLGVEDLGDWINKTIYYETLPYRLIGIVNDVSQESLRINSKPHIYTKVSRDKFYSVKLNTDDLTTAVDKVQEIFNSSFTTSHFDYFFLDTYFNRQYKADRLFGKIFSFFSILAIVITSLGLFGLSLYNITQRAREVSIRKVLGASIKNILYLLTKEYILLMLVASAIALPIGYYFVEQWLKGFANRMEVTEILFVIPVMLILILTMITVCYQVVKAAYSNPADTLRYE